MSVQVSTTVPQQVRCSLPSVIAGRLPNALKRRPSSSQDVRMRPANAAPFTALIPLEPEHPILIEYQPAALLMALVEPAHLRLLDETWERPGIYALLYPIAEDASFPLYIGKAGTGGLKSRLGTHRGTKQGWIRALLVARDTRHGFNSAQVGWLEGRLWSLAKAGARTRLGNTVEPRDETLPTYERTALEAVLPPIVQVLRLAGYSLEPEDEPVVEAAGPGRVGTGLRRSHFGVSVADLLRVGLLRPGQALEFTYSGFQGRVGQVEGDGRIAVEGQVHATLSAAAAALRGGATNGWEHWGTRDAAGNLVSLAELRAQLREVTATGTAPALETVESGARADWDANG